MHSLVRCGFPERAIDVDVVPPAKESTTVTGGYIYGFKPAKDGFMCVIDRFKPVNVAPCDRSGGPAGV